MTPEVEFRIPDPPDHSLALAEIPEDIQEQWRAAYVQSYKEQAEENPPTTEDDHKRLRTAALSFANKKIIRVKEPKSYDDAIELPKWQLMLKEKVEYAKLPKHAVDEIKLAKGRKSGTYLRVYTTDGREYFFAVPEKVAT